MHPDYRTGTVIALLWGGLARYLRGGGYAYAIGSASVAARPDRRLASAICRRLLADQLAPAAWRVEPRTPFALDDVEPASPSALPPLIRGYLRLGASVCGAPAWDPDFATADLLLILPIDRLDGRWARRLLRS